MSRNTSRHFFALMKKNWIIYKRNPCSAMCNLVTPVVLMLIMVWLRTKITPSYVDSSNLLRLSHPVYTIATKGNNLDPIKSTRALEDYFLFNNYTDIFGVGYDVLYDYQSPSYFYPSNCGQGSSLDKENTPSTIIAIVGQNNTVSDNVHFYLDTLFKDQGVLGSGLLPLFQWFETQEDLFSYISSETYLSPDLGICFGYQVTTNSASDYDVKLYFDDQRLFGGAASAGIPPQQDLAANTAENKPRLKNYEQYALDGYSFMQNVIANMLLREVTQKPDANINMLYVPFQSSSLTVDKFQALNSVFANMVSLLYILPVFNTVFYIVKEKEQRAKESMRMMGLNDMPYWLSWFCFYTIQNTITSFLAWLTLSINMFAESNQFLIFLTIWCYGQSVFGEIIMIQALFSKSKYAGIVATVIYFMLSFFNIFMLTGTGGIDNAGIVTLCIIPQVCLFQMVYWIFNYESVGIGFTPDMMWVSNINIFCPGIGFIMLTLGFLLFLMIGVYLEYVVPSEFGKQLHPCFPFMPRSYTCCKKKRGQAVGDDDEDGDQQAEALLQDTDNDELEVRSLMPENYEPVQAEIARQELDGRYLRIENLQKTYENGFQAVKGINLKIYQNQIFALLGQNGAGKSTTISMLTGLIQKSKGAASVFNLDMFKQGSEVRQFMGVCPQHDVLFDYLTPVEHLQIFYDFKGGDPAKKTQEIIDLIRDVGLEEDQSKPAGSLSGGNKRKLSVAIAMCGGSKLVLLDEPTAGMDLGARRALWDMLKNYRSDRIIILTTHYMDEADVLGDRIGIMAKGQMMCLGSSLFLKKRFGAGYKLTMVKETKEKNKLILPYLEKHLGSAELISEVSSEISFGVTTEVASKFTEFFRQFDEDMTMLGVVSYGISITTLEEVFLHINKEFGLELQMAEAEKLAADTATEGPSDEPMIQEEDPYFEGAAGIRKPITLIDSPESRSSIVRSNGLNDSSTSLTQSKAKFSRITTDVETGSMNGATECLVFPSTIKENISALLSKRFHVYKRDRAGLVCEVIVPFLMVLVGCSMTKIQLQSAQVTRTLSPDLYPSPQRILMNSENVVNSGVGDISPSTLFANLPQSSTSFEVSYVENNATFTEFYDDVFEARNVGELMPYRYGSYQVYKADNTSMQYCVNSFLNLTSQDVTAAFPQFIYESILQTASGNPEFNFQVTTVPYPSIYELQQRQKQGNAFEFSFMVGIGLALIPCAMISFILKEKMDSLKHMQLISGMSLPAYWISNMIADIAKVYIPLILMILLSVVFNCNYPGVWVLFMLLPWALVPFTYVTSFMFSDDSSGQITTLLVHFLVCVILATTVYFLQCIPETFSVGDKLRWWLCIVPTYCLMNGILWSSSGDSILESRQSNVDKYPQLPSGLWAFENLGGDVFMLILHFFVDSGILVAIEMNAFAFIKRYFEKKAPERDNTIELDNDVQAEEERVGENKSEVVRVFNFRKAYTKTFGKPFLAVENISFGLDYGECFALLGVNGAGKSTTFKSLTAGVVPSQGEISIAGYDIQTQFDQVRRLIGYCPQHDAIFPLMTVEEHLWFYAKLKGIPVDKREIVIETAIEQLNLTDHRSKPAGTLSGGNKRKLSVGMATLGNPPIILLDEPSAGMDPEARRFMWQVVANISQRDKNSAVIITTHSMEEAEALSTKMGIMVRGGIFRCYGSSQHIKSKFGTGYELEIKIKKPSYLELKELAEKLGFVESPEDRVDLDDAKARAVVRGINSTLIEQIKSQGLGSDLAMEAAQGGNSVRVKNLITYFYTLTAGMKVIEFLCGHFSKVELYEQCSDFFKMRIPRESQTIGHLFGVVQENKDQLLISEYSVSQTSLEQIFQTFANSSSKKQQKSFTFHIESGTFKLIEYIEQQLE